MAYQLRSAGLWSGTSYQGQKPAAATLAYGCQGVNRYLGLRRWGGLNLERATGGSRFGRGERLNLYRRHPEVVARLTDAICDYGEGIADDHWFRERRI